MGIIIDVAVSLMSKQHITVSHGSAYAVVRATQQVNEERQFW